MVILVALIFSLFRLVIPYITDYGKIIETELSEAIGMPVEITSVDADIYWLTPRLNLYDVNIFSNDGRQRFLHFDEVSLSLDWTKTIQSLVPTLGTVSLSGADLFIVRDAQGEISIQGYEIDASQASHTELTPELYELIENLSLYIVNSRLYWRDAINNHQKLDLKQVNLAIINDAPSHKLSIDMVLPESYGQHLQVIADIEGVLQQPKTWQGKVFARFDNVKLEKWFDDFWQYLEFTGGGRIDGNLMIEWDQHQVINANAFINGDHLSLHYLDDEVHSWQLDHLTGFVEWQKTQPGWTVDVRGLDVRRQNTIWPMPAAISIEMDQLSNHLDLQANFMRLEGLAYIAGLVTSFVTIGDLDWQSTVAPFAPVGDLYNLNMSIPLDHPEKIAINTRFENLGYRAQGDIPTMVGLDGALSHNGDVSVLNLDAKDVELDFHGLFRDPIQLKSASGQVKLLRQDNEWRLQSERISAVTPHLDTRSRIDLRVADDAPTFIDLVMEFDQGDGSYKSLYLPVTTMSENSINWIDRSIVEAEVPYGQFVLYGNLQDFPFKQGEGVMEVFFKIKNARLKYLENWPALENLQANVRFYNESMSIEKASGNIFNAQFSQTEAMIEDLQNVHLSVDGKVQSPLADLLKFIKQSPLEETLGSYLTRMQTTGDAGLDINIQIPIAEEKPGKVTGLLSFKNNDVYLPEQDYQFRDFFGELAFTQDQIKADNLQARIGDYPVQMRINTQRQDKKSTTHIALKTHAAVSSLLAPVPALRDYLSGESDWQIDISIPSIQDDQAELVGINVISDLRGVVSSLPGALAKTADDSAPFLFQLGIEKEEVLRSRAQFGDQYDLRADRQSGRWFVDIQSSSLKAQARFMEDFKSNDPMQLDVEYADITKLKGEGDEARKSKLKPIDIPPLQFRAQVVDWNQLRMADVNLQTRRIKQGMEIEHFEFHGPAMSVIGKGSWLSSWRYPHQTSLDFKVSSHDLGQGAAKLGITESIKNANGKAEFKWQWQAEPYNFSWDLVNGQASFELEDGRLSDIEVGAGRLLGLLNFETLLSMDFGNQVSEGFAFDEMYGHFDFKQGDAYTEDFTVESKVAEIVMKGRIGFASEDYDQTVTVIPGVGSTLTVLGAVTGGPVTAAAIHLFQKLFGFDRIAKYEYSVTGSWDNPQVELMSAPEPVPESTEVTEDDF